MLGDAIYCDGTAETRPPNGELILVRFGEQDPVTVRRHGKRLVYARRGGAWIQADRGYWWAPLALPPEGL